MTIDKKAVIQNAPYVIFFWLGDKLSCSVRLSGTNIVSGLMKGIAELFNAPFFSFNPIDMLIGAATALAVKGVLYIKSKNAKKYRKGKYAPICWVGSCDILYSISFRSSSVTGQRSTIFLFLFAIYILRFL